MKVFRLQFKNAKPFSHLELKGFLNEDLATSLLNALAKEHFESNEADLFKLKQSRDFISTTNPTLKRFRQFLLSEEFISYMESLTNLRIKRGVIDLAGSLYENSDFLLCHDDQLEGRAIAFLFYLTDMGKNDGGALALIDKKGKTALRIQPQFNTFAFFEVSPLSFHEVEEVLSAKQRIAIGGWYHAQ
jgi:prolyl 3-hydroxylase /prolyl 3,4-dihydroxylase